MYTKSTRRTLSHTDGRRLRFEPLEARRLLATYVVDTTADAGLGSLRQAIFDANANPGADDIHFNIGTGLQTIAPLTALPGIIDATNIDATTQPGYAGSPLIVLNGAAAGMTSNGLLITASDSVVRGLVINGFRQSGIRVEGGDRNVFEDNYIGTDASGTVAVPNGNGPSPSGTVDVTTGAINLVGSAANATSDNRIEGNLISGNNTAGVRLRDGGGNVIKDNLIGTDVAGTVAMGNLGFGVIFNPNGRINNRIEGNVLSATRRAPLEGGDGIKLQNTSNQNVIVDNKIGTDLTGTIALGNERWGVFIQAASSGNLIQGNLISGNREDGVQVRDGRSDNNIISQNLIGTDVTGSTPLGNGFAGIDIRSTASNNTVVGNTIAYNGRAGVIVQSLAINNRITQNSIHSNGALGIDLLLPAGPNPNDPQDPDLGGNRLQNYPVITSVITTGSSTIIEGTLNSAPNEAFTIEFFRNLMADPSGFGEGQTFIGDTTVTTDGDGNATFTVVFAGVPAGEVITATATDIAGNTSEFSGATTVEPVPPGSIFLIPDVCHPGETALIVNGTPMDDNIHIAPSGGGVEVTMNGVSQGTYQPTGRIIVYGYAGNDNVQLAGSVPNEAWLYGDSGDDHLNLGSGGGIAFGGDGNDHLLGGNSHDILVGGYGSDRLVGNSQDDILIAAFSVYDDRFTSPVHEAAWCAIYHEWNRSDHTYEQRVANVQDGSGTVDRDNGPFFLNESLPLPTVFDDDAEDKLTGASGRDWFFANLVGPGTLDKITDLKNNEFAEELIL